jgi:hypothetical protein
VSAANEAIERIVRKALEGREVELVDGVTGDLAWMPEPGMKSMQCFLISDAFEPSLRSDAPFGDGLSDDEHQIRSVYMLDSEVDLLNKGRIQASRI